MSTETDHRDCVPRVAANNAHCIAIVGQGEPPHQVDTPQAQLEDLELAVQKDRKGDLAGALLSLFGKRLIISTTRDGPRSSVITYSLADGQ